MNTPTPPAASTRLDHLDAVRAFALLLGIVFHAATSFLPVYIGWAVMDVSTSPVVGKLMLVSHSFRMPLFFLIAGFFSHRTLHRKGVRAFLASRMLRIAVPFVAGWFLLRPLLVAAWIMGGESLRGEVRIFPALSSGFQSLGQLPEGLLTGTHLWFLYYLLLVTGLTLGVRAVAAILPGWRRAIMGRFDAVAGWISDPIRAGLLASIPTGACLWGMDLWGMDTPDRSLVPHLPVLLVYGGFFGFGWLLDRQDGLIGRFGRISPGSGILGISGAVIAVWLADYQAQPGHPRIGLIRAAFCLSYAVMMWSLVAFTIGFFRRHLDRPNRVVRYLADASYWLYLVHLPVVIWLQIAFAELPLHWSLKLVAIPTLTVGISVVVYDLLVRPTMLGALLNGRRRERVLFRRGTGTPPPAVHGGADAR